ncbi:MAG TPA: TonB-dependent receptor [Sphingobium sp.]|nr:TonB-dependent receptor [Sphingobium sp.]
MKHALLLSAALVAPALVQPQNARASEPAIIITATRTAQPAERLPYTALTLGETELSASDSIAAALDWLPDVYVQMPGGRSGIASLFLRGADPNFTTVLLDGVPLNMPTNTRGGAVNLAELPTSPIERVELVAGPVSTLYGSGALAGAVNLLVPGGTPHHQLATSVGAGSDGDYLASARWQGPLTAQYGASLSGVIDDAGTGVPEARFRSRSLTARVAPLEGDDAGRLLFHWSSAHARSFPDSSGGYRLATIRTLEQRDSETLIIGAQHPLLRRDHVRLDLSASYLDRRDVTDSPGVAPSAPDPAGVPAGYDDTSYRQWIARSVLRFDQAGWRGAAGVEGQWEDAHSQGFLDFGFPMPSGFTADRASYAAFAEISRSTDRLEWNGGARLNRISGIGTHMTGRAGLRYFLAADHLSVRATLGTAFKAPSFYALSNPFVGNPDLRPESARSAELGLNWTGEGADTVAVTLFHARYSDLVDFIPGPPPRLENRDRVTARGISATATRQLAARWLATAQVQYVETTDDASGQPLLNRPPWRASATLQWTPDAALAITARYAFTDARSDYAGPVGIRPLAPAHRASLAAHWRVADGTGLDLVADNLLDNRSEDAIGFPSPRRSLRVKISRVIR